MEINALPKLYAEGPVFINLSPSIFCERDHKADHPDVASAKSGIGKNPTGRFGQVRKI